MKPIKLSVVIPARNTTVNGGVSCVSNDFQIPRDSQCDCLSLCRSCGERLQPSSETFVGVPPSPVCVHGHSQLELHVDGLDDTAKDNPDHLGQLGGYGGYRNTSLNNTGYDCSGREICNRFCDSSHSSTSPCLLESSGSFLQQYFYLVDSTTYPS